MKTKKKSGRPPLPSGESRRMNLQIRLTDGEWIAVTEKAKNEGMAVSEWARLSIMKSV